MEKENETLSLASDKVHVVFGRDVGCLRSAFSKMLSNLGLQNVFMVVGKDELFKAHVDFACLRLFQIVYINCHYKYRKLRRHLGNIRLLLTPFS